MSLLTLLFVILGAMACIGDASHVGHEYKSLELEEGGVTRERERTVADGAVLVDFGDGDATLSIDGQLCFLKFEPPLHEISCYFSKYMESDLYQDIYRVLRGYPRPGSLINGHAMVHSGLIMTFNLTELAVNDQDRKSHHSSMRRFLLTTGKADLARSIFVIILAAMIWPVVIAIIVLITST